MRLLAQAAAIIVLLPFGIIPSQKAPPNAMEAIAISKGFWTRVGERPNFSGVKVAMTKVVDSSWHVYTRDGFESYIDMNGIVTMAVNSRLDRNASRSSKAYLSSSGARIAIRDIARRIRPQSDYELESFILRPVLPKVPLGIEGRQGYAGDRAAGLIGGYKVNDQFYGMTISVDLGSGRLVVFSQNWTYPPVQKIRVLISERQAKSMLLGKRLAELGPKAKARLGWVKTPDGKSARLAWRVDVPSEHQDVATYLDAETGIRFSR